MQALRHPDGHEDVYANNGLAIAKAAFERPAGFHHSRLDNSLRGVCQTQAKVPMTLREDVTPVDASSLVRRADHDLVVRLCRMPPDLAAPLLRSTLPALNAAALLTVLAATGEEHHRLVAGPTASRLARGQGGDPPRQALRSHSPGRKHQRRP
ncbi:MAG: hypothetical protein WDN06_19625 [Asticcacaulis sp.]